jgi:hypothetical protein
MALSGIAIPGICALWQVFSEKLQDVNYTGGIIFNAVVAPVAG